MITQLNVINVFTDDYGQIKPEGKELKTTQYSLQGLNYFYFCNRRVGDL